MPYLTTKINSGASRKTNYLQKKIVMSGTVLDENGNRLKVNIEEPRWDQSTYLGRAQHFFTTANPLNVFATPSQLDHANEIVTKYRKVNSEAEF